MNTPFPVREDGKFSVEEFFALIESRPEEERWQLIDGVAMMMPPPTRIHQLIASNLTFELNTHFRAHRPQLCALQEVGLIVPQAELFRPEADVAVVDLIGGYESYINRFYCVAEILSDSNTDKDIAVKRRRYVQHPDNLYFLLLKQKHVHVELLARADGWQPRILDRLEDTLELPAFGFHTDLASLYRGTPLARPASP
jgi:Uma2 family endonuclease